MDVLGRRRYSRSFRSVVEVFRLKELKVASSKGYQESSGFEQAPEPYAPQLS